MFNNQINANIRFILEWDTRKNNLVLKECPHTSSFESDLSVSHLFAILSKSAIYFKVDTYLITVTDNKLYIIVQYFVAREFCLT